MQNDIKVGDTVTCRTDSTLSFPYWSKAKVVAIKKGILFSRYLVEEGHFLYPKFSWQLIKITNPNADE